MSLLICPNCKTGMKAITRYDVEIDVCPDCQGVWLDRGELDQLLTAVRSGDPAQPRQQDEAQGYRRPRSAPWEGGARHDDDDDDHHGRGARRDDDHDQEGKRRGWRGMLDIFD